MRLLYAFSRAVDGINARIGGIADWLVLIAVLVSAGNAASRYLFNLTSNGFLEAQWYMFAAIVLLGAPLTLKLNEHVRVDLFYSVVSPRTRLFIDIFGLVVFLLPAMAFLAWLSWPVFYRAWASGEASGNYGGLIRWPVLALIPLGFALLFLQGLSELVKRIGALRGEVRLDTRYEQPLQ